MNEKLEELLAQENDLQFASFSHQDALELGLIIIEIARSEIRKGVAVHIENGDHDLFTHYMDGTTKENQYWIATKKNVVNHFRHSSLYIGELFKAQGTTFAKSSKLSLSEYQGEGGAFPVIIRGQGMSGTITVSGLTGEEDHALALEGIKRLLSART